MDWRSMASKCWFTKKHHTVAVYVFFFSSWKIKMQKIQCDLRGKNSWRSVALKILSFQLEGAPLLSYKRLAGVNGYAFYFSIIENKNAHRN